MGKLYPGRRDVFVLVLLSILIGTLPLFSSPYQFSSLNMASGLSNNSVFCFLQDSLGYMWIGTFGGLNRYDGTEFVSYKPDPSSLSSITSSVIFDIFEDSSNRIWVGTDGGGLNLYDRESDTFTAYRFDPDDPRSLSSNQVFTIFEDSSNTLWVGTGGGGLNRMGDDGSFYGYLADPEDRFALHSNIIRKIIQDTNGVIWVATDGGGLARYLPDEDLFTSYDYLYVRNDGTEIIGSSIKALYEDTTGRLWVGFEDTGLALFDDRLKQFIPIQLSESDGLISVRAITEDAVGNIWVGTDGQGMFVIEHPLSDDMRINSICQQDGELNNNRIRDIFIDMTGLIWIGMRDGGINLFNPLSRSFSRLFTDHQVKEITETSDHAIWAAVDGGPLMRIDPLSQEITYPVVLVDDAHMNTSALFPDQDQLWIGTDGAGLFCYDLSEQKIKEHYTTSDQSNLQSDVIWDIFRDSSGTLWVGTENGGLHAFDSDSGTFEYYQFEKNDASSIIGNSVRAIFEDSRGNLWIGTWDGGLNRFISKEEGFERFTLAPGDISSLGDNSVNTIFEDSAENLWIGTTGGGLNLFDRNSRSFSSFGTEEGLCSDNIFGITEDAAQRLWITTDNGLTRFDPKTHTVVNFWTEDGLTGDEFSQKSCFKASDGTVYLGGRAGITHFIPEEIIPRSVESPFLVTGLKLQNKNITVGPLVLEDSHEIRSLLEQPLYENPTITFAPNDRFITFSFSLFDFVKPSKHLYAVKLDGLDSAWTELGHKNSITFATIPPGSYVLRIRATHYNGMPHPAEQFVTIHVDKYLYQQWYFILGVFLVFTGIFFFISKLRIRALHAKNASLRQYSINIQEAREKEGKAIAREIHDQLGQILTLLKFNLFRMRKQMHQQIGLTGSLISQSDSAIKLVDEAIHSVRTISTRFRPSALDSMSLAEALQWQMTEFSSRTGIQVSMDITSELHPINEDLLTTIYRVLQEILTNIIRHAQATAVTCVFYENGTHYYLQISDNGIGCTKKQIKSNTAFGIISICERCEALRGSVRISSKSMKGPSFISGIPVLNEQQRMKREPNGTRIEILLPVSRGER